MDDDLKGKVAVVSGAGQGVGREIAAVLSSQGASVVINDLYLDRAEKVVREITDRGGRALAIKADVTDRDEVKAMVARAEKELGPVDILVVNTGVIVELRTGELSRGPFAESSPELWKKVTDLNFYGCLNCVHAVINSMITRRSGKIISIISDAGRTGEVNMAVYSGAKAGILGFSKALAREVGRYCINVNCVSLGAMAHEATPKFKPDAAPESDELLNKTLKVYPIGRGLGRVGRPADAAQAVAFLASSKAEFITGQCLSVSGGFSMVS